MSWFGQPVRFSWKDFHLDLPDFSVASHSEEMATGRNSHRPFRITNVKSVHGHFQIGDYLKRERGVSTPRRLRLQPLYVFRPDYLGPRYSLTVSGSSPIVPYLDV